ncbi:MAG TPA: M23 family metallopeptidase [Candidatus Limnocylindrales bacterium]|nr:M23 family metallopeptidase [Candidatus Limnocylindrales bacterium]
MLNAVSGVVRDCFARDRSTRLDRPATEPIPSATARPAHRRAIGAARVCADLLTATPKARRRASVATRETGERIAARVARATPRGSIRRRLFRRHLVLRFTAERSLPIAIALIVVAAASFSLAPAAPVGAAQGAASAADVETTRLAIGGKVDAFSDLEDQGYFEEPSFDVAAVDDGTLYKPVAVDTTIQTSAGLLRHYTVKEGDTLTSIASRYGVSMMTVWWANKLTSKEQLKAGKNLVIPPVSGLVVTVAAGDTLESIAKANKITVDQIIATNELTDTNLIVGQVLLLQGAKGEPMPTAKPIPTAKPRTSGGGGGGGFVPVSGSWAWPVPGGYVSQYFHYGHYGVDIADSYGSPIVAPRDGTVVFAGWKSNGGGYQVWINHGNGIYSAQHHMSSVSVAAGQAVAKGQRIGRIGQSGWATGPHDHFEVWVGRPWENGSYRVNALRYY